MSKYILYIINFHTFRFNKTINELRENIGKVENQMLAAELHNTVNKLICCLDLFKAKSKDDDKSKNSSFLPSCFSIKQIDTKNSYSFGGFKTLHLDNKERSSTAEIQLNSANNGSLNNNLNNVMNQMSNTTSNGTPNNTAKSATQKTQEQQQFLQTIFANSNEAFQNPLSAVNINSNKLFGFGGYDFFNSINNFNNLNTGNTMNKSSPFQNQFSSTNNTNYMNIINNDLNVFSNKNASSSKTGTLKINNSSSNTSSFLNQTSKKTESPSHIKAVFDHNIFDTFNTSLLKTFGIDNGVHSKNNESKGASSSYSLKDLLNKTDDK